MDRINPPSKVRVKLGHKGVSIFREFSLAEPCTVDAPKIHRYIDKTNMFTLKSGMTLVLAIVLSMMLRIKSGSSRIFSISAWRGNGGDHFLMAVEMLKMLSCKLCLLSSSIFDFAALQASTCINQILG